MLVTNVVITTERNITNENGEIFGIASHIEVRM